MLHLVGLLHIAIWRTVHTALNQVLILQVMLRQTTATPSTLPRQCPKGGSRPLMWTSVLFIIQYHHSSATYKYRAGYDVPTMVQFKIRHLWCYAVSTGQQLLVSLRHQTASKCGYIPDYTVQHLRGLESWSTSIILSILFNNYCASNSMFLNTLCAEDAIWSANETYQYPISVVSKV